ncbi:MAG: hypothetical protein JKX90_01900 [Colwellia sp.]|nr:hypothetical protein [Colwellia sp.]
MAIVDINLWPNMPYIPALFGMEIDHLWVSNQHKVYFRNRISHLAWSDHYPIPTHISFAARQKY